MKTLLVINGTDYTPWLSGLTESDDIPVVLNRITMADGSTTIIQAPYRKTELVCRFSAMSGADYLGLRGDLEGQPEVGWWSERGNQMASGMFFADITNYSIKHENEDLSLIDPFTIILTRMDQNG
jgi:hypothetical protein